MADLRPYIYHEVQDRNGSMLCAQHCLNNLLQQHLYSEFDLADLATNLDAQENAELAPADRRDTSQNMDDTGFFSLSVLENALQVFDLTLVRWRGESMRRFHDHPENQTAFVLNLQSHWLPLRRFSTSSRWYNLNSFLRQPDWISPTYLQMVLTEAENEGYSVFVVRKLSEIEEDEADRAGSGTGNEVQGLGILPECQADMIALELGDPAGRAGAGVEDMLNNVTRNPASDNDSYASAARSAQPQASGSRTASVSAPQLSSSSSSFAELDPVAASLARSKADLARFQQEQSSALFESQAYNPPQPRRRRQGDVPDIFGQETGPEVNETEEGMEGVRQAQPLNRFQRQQLEEEEMMRQAIEESLRDAQARGETIDVDQVVDDAGNGGSIGPAGHAQVVNEVAPPFAPSSRPRSTPPQPASTTVPIDIDPEDEELDEDLEDHAAPVEPVYDFMAQSRYYDDDDAALQAALSASLAEGVPDGWVPPPPKVAVPASARTEPQQAPPSTSPSLPAPSAIGQGKHRVASPSETADESDEDEVDDEEEEEPEPAVLSPEELRRKRLERFR